MVKETDLRLGFTDVLKSPTAYEAMDRSVLQPRLLLCLHGTGSRQQPTQHTLSPPGIGKLAAFKVAYLSKPGRYCDGAGLYLQISPKGTKSWIFRYIHHGELCAEKGNDILELPPPQAGEGRAVGANNYSPLRRGHAHDAKPASSMAQTHKKNLGSNTCCPSAVETYWQSTEIHFVSAS